MVFCQLKFNICVRCDMAFIEPMHHNKPNITYLLTSASATLRSSSVVHLALVGSVGFSDWKYSTGWALRMWSEHPPLVVKEQGQCGHGMDPLSPPWPVLIRCLSRTKVMCLNRALPMLSLWRGLGILFASHHTMCGASTRLSPRRGPETAYRHSGGIALWWSVSMTADSHSTSPGYLRRK